MRNRILLISESSYTQGALGSGPKVKSHATVLWRQTRGLRLPLWGQTRRLRQTRGLRDSAEKKFLPMLIINYK